LCFLVYVASKWVFAFLSAFDYDLYGFPEFLVCRCLS
jgi:uncharacterized protein YwgA